MHSRVLSLSRASFQLTSRPHSFQALSKPVNRTLNTPHVFRATPQRTEQSLNAMMAQVLPAPASLPKVDPVVKPSTPSAPNPLSNMKGGGHYNQNSSIQGAAVSAFEPYIWEAVAKGSFTYPLVAQSSPSSIMASLSSGNLDAPVASPIVVVDYGSCEGFNSLSPIGSFIDAIRARVTTGLEAARPHDEHPLPVMVIHNDLPSNDFSSLFNLVQTHDRSYLRTRENVTVLASGTSFYQRVMPRQSVHYGFSSIAMHWLSKLPCKLSSAMNHLFLVAESPEAVAFRAQAADDWRRILSFRSQELVHGGVFSVIISCVDDNLHSPLKYGIGVMYDVALEMKQEGLLTADEVKDLTIGHYLRSRAELTDPALLSSCGLELIRAEFKRPSNPIYEEFKRTNDAARFARAWVGYNQARMEPMIAGAFKNDKEKTAVFFQRLEQRVLADPNKHEYNGADRMFVCFRKL